MSYFPAFITLKNKRILIVGAGKVAYEKLEHLLDFTEEICIISQDFTQQTTELIHEYSLEHLQRSYQTGDIKDFDVIIIAVDDIPLQAKIYEEARQYRCLCNAVDSVDYCDFIFPSYIKKGDLTIAVSTSGASPALAKQLRIYLQKLIPENISSFLLEMKALRKTLPKGKERMHLLEEKAKAYIKKLGK